MNYTVFDPTGNVTALAEGEPSVSVAAAIMAREPETEQVGFVSFPENGTVSLQMAGGEFCGNATLCAAALGCARTDVSAVTVLASGAEKPLKVEVSRISDRCFAAEGELPLPLSITEQQLDDFALPIVRFSGITHAISQAPLDRETAERLVQRWCRQLRADAMGLMLWDEAAQTLKPLVYVPAANTLFWEQSCASGSAAIGAWLSQKSGKPVTAEIRQPGGTLQISASADKIMLRETVKLRKTDCF